MARPNTVNLNDDDDDYAYENGNTVAQIGKDGKTRGQEMSDFERATYKGEVPPTNGNQQPQQNTQQADNGKDKTIGQKVGGGIDKFNHGVAYAGTTALGVAGVGADIVKGAVKGTVGVVKGAGSLVKGTAEVGADVVKGVGKGVADVGKFAIGKIHDRGAKMLPSSVSKSSAQPNAAIEKNAIANKDQVLAAQQQQQQPDMGLQNGVKSEAPDDYGLTMG